MSSLLHTYSGASKKFGWKGTQGDPVTLTPKLSDMWFVEFTFASLKDAKDVSRFSPIQTAQRFSALANRVDSPTINVTHQSANQYNKRIHIPTAVDFGAVNMSFYDTVDGAMFDFASAIYNTYFKNNSLSTEDGQLDKTISDLNSGLKFRDNTAPKEQHTFKKITIHHFFGNAKNGSGSLQEIVLVNPLVTSIQFDAHDYSTSDARKINISFQPENVMFGETVDGVVTPPWIVDENDIKKDDLPIMNGNERKIGQIESNDIRRNEANQYTPNRIGPGLIPESRPAFDPKEINKKLIGADKRIWEEFGGKDATGDRFRNQQDQLNAIQRIDDFINGIIRGL